MAMIAINYEDFSALAGELQLYWLQGQRAP
jgi:hypothetical protein